MTPTPRAVAAVVLLAGAAVGTLADHVPDRVPRRAGDYWLLAGDFHVHAFPGDGALAPWVLRDEAARAGLDVFAVTNHNRVFTARLGRWVATLGGGPILVPGEEITNPDYHLIAVGVDRAVPGDLPAPAAIAAVHAQGGAAIAAHPSRRFHGWDDDATVAALDGVEVAHAEIHRNPQFRQDLAAFYQRTRRINGRVAAIGSSDYHASPPVGESRTLVFARERTAAGVVAAIRAGRTVAWDADGVLYGDAALVALARGALPDGPDDRNPGWRRIAVMLAWVGALGMLLGRGARSA